MENRFEFYTEYNQFLITSDNIKELLSNEGSDDEGYEDRLQSYKNSLIVYTQCYGYVKGELVFIDTAVNNIDYDLYDHIVEAGINVESGKIQILDCPSSLVEYTKHIKPGKYKVRVYSINLDSVKERDLANKTDNDYYKIEIWPDDNMERRVLKRYHDKK
ncbi:hypothetical protein FUA48_02415 [Flavobacterium alkalisoli]|uniref:Uncharacterized protein n=1 Tax=Flavobacterium alkalisoli TaxID=2602769 RepID=A0A5B9FUR9_9FLAO|nr:hypothetical protein [Flavobacterium alkalisoli]QEE48467.1 hypothetical protein FUA48_02415 [Flavobacterium alkalisoli]